MNLTIIRPARTEGGLIIAAGQTVRYLGHVPGGMIKVEYTGKHAGSVEVVIDPRTTKELSN